MMPMADDTEVKARQEVVEERVRRAKELAVQSALHIYGERLLDETVRVGLCTPEELAQALHHTLHQHEGLMVIPGRFTVALRVSWQFTADDQEVAEAVSRARKAGRA